MLVPGLSFTEEIMSNKCIDPVIFITGIGQTWTTLKGSTGERWNLIPSSKEILFRDFDFKKYLKLAKIGLGAGLSVLSKKDLIDKKALSVIFRTMFSPCIVDENGYLPDDIDVKIYGARSFDVLKVTDFNTGKMVNPNGDTLLKRLYRDIPCQELAKQIGEENLYCFNYSSFSDLYDDADALQNMIKGVIEDQKNKTGSDKVILVPMSMGATVVTAYLDKYYNESSAIEENHISKIISIVGAWNGSDALADLLTFNIRPDFVSMLKSSVPRTVSEIISKTSEKNLLDVAHTFLSSIIDNVILNTTSFMALVPKERFYQVSELVFADTTDIRKQKLKERATKYYNAQMNLLSKFDMLKSKYEVGLYFICGYNLSFGEKSRDFSFLSYFNSALNTNSDSVIQISSTAPGTAFSVCGTKLNCKDTGYLSPDKTIDASQSPFKDSIWYFEGQDHELGCNNTALKIAGDIAMGITDKVNEKYPQFNQSRDIKNTYEMIELAKKMCSSGKLPENKRVSLEIAVEQAKIMLENVYNNPENDNAVIKALMNELNTVLV